MISPINNKTDVYKQFYNQRQCKKTKKNMAKSTIPYIAGGTIGGALFNFIPIKYKKDLAGMKVPDFLKDFFPPQEMFDNHQVKGIKYLPRWIKISIGVILGVTIAKIGKIFMSSNNQN